MASILIKMSEEMKKEVSKKCNFSNISMTKYILELIKEDLNIECVNDITPPESRIMFWTINYVENLKIDEIIGRPVKDVYNDYVEFCKDPVNDVCVIETQQALTRTINKKFGTESRPIRVEKKFKRVFCKIK